MDRRALIAAAAALILPAVALHEGRRTDAYQDVVQVWTICYGNTTIDMRPVKEGDTATPAECERMLQKDLQAHCDDALRLTTVPLLPSQLAALCSFTYNLGAKAYAGSTLRRKLNSGDYCGAAAEFPRWNKAGGKVYRGLTLRRKSEQSMFLKDSPCSTS